jgi:hypothetical protein
MDETNGFAGSYDGSLRVFERIGLDCDSKKFTCSREMAAFEVWLSLLQKFDLIVRYAELW